MKKIILFYNPQSGSGNFSASIDKFLAQFQPKYEVTISRLMNIDLLNYFNKIDKNSYDIIVVAGGDGTVNSVVNAMLKNNIDIPLAIIPSGTVNDFASYFKMTANFKELFEIIENNQIKRVDLGKVNKDYFINVCSGGFVTTIPHKTDSKLKNKLGKVAYYLKGIQEFPGFKSLPLRFNTNNNEFEENIFMYLILNSNRAGGFKNINPANVINDGEFELIAIKYGNLYEMSNALIDVFINKNLTNKKVIYQKIKSIRIEPLKERFEDHTDIDGEKGPDYPLNIKVIPRKLSIYYN